MPVNVNDGEQYAYALAQAYADAEVAIVRALADAVSRGLDLETLQDYQRAQMGQLQRMRDQVVRELRKVNTGLASNLVRRVNDAYRRGGLEMLAELRDAPNADAIPPARSAAVRALVADATRKLNDAAPQILRQAEDVYRSVVAAVSASVAAGPQVTRRRATQQAIDKYLGDGITGFVDSRGRNWNITDYATMALRTATARAAIQGHIETAQSLNLTLVILRAGPRCCDLCAEWVDRILSSDGSPAGVYTVQSETALEDIQVTVYGSLDQARAGGWGHPNDRCNIQTYIPGATSTPAPQEWDEQGYKAQQGQRAIERAIRGAKVRQAAAITPEAEAEARQRVRDAQARMRAHLEEFPFLKRQSDREQIGGNYGPRVSPRPPKVSPSPSRPPAAPRPAPTPPRAPEPTPRLSLADRIAQAPDNGLAALQRRVDLMIQFDPAKWSEADIRHQSEEARAAWAEAKTLDRRDILMAAGQIRQRQLKFMQQLAADMNAPNRIPPGFLAEEKRGREMFLAEAVPGANPLFRTDRNARVNCSYVVAAVELRKRGFDVVARPIANGIGRTPSEMAEDWYDPKTGIARQFSPMFNNREEIEKEMADWPVGARGFVSGAWTRWKGAHVFNVVKTGPGTYSYLEGQDNTVAPSQSAKYPDQMRHLQVLRVDDLQPSARIAEAVKPK